MNAYKLHLILHTADAETTTHSVFSAGKNRVEELNTVLESYPLVLAETEEAAAAKLAPILRENMSAGCNTAPAEHIRIELSTLKIEEGGLMWLNSWTITPGRKHKITD